MGPITLRRQGRPRASAITSGGDATPAPAPAAGPDIEAVAAVRDLRVEFRRGGHPVHALRGVSLRIDPGEVVAVVGESGSGKSVLGLALLGLLGPDAGVKGSAVVCGVDMVTANKEQRRLVRQRHLGAVFQDPMTSLNPSMRIGRQLVEATESVEEAVRLLDLTGVPDPRRRLRAYPHELSGGLRQRVMISMAVAGRPKLVVADEPTTALDVTVQAQILALLSSLRAELGTSFLFVTHDLGVAGSLADRALIFYGGRLVESGPIGEVVAAPAHHYTAGLLGSRLELRRGRDARRPRATLGGFPVDPRSDAPGCLFAPRCAAAGPDCTSGVPPLRPLAGAAREVACVRPVTSTSAAANPVAETIEPDPPRSSTDMALRLRDLRCDFKTKSGPLAALRGVDLDVAAGESIAIVGESGCGKSTLLRIVAGLAAATGGTVELSGDQRPQMVFQDAGASLTPWLTVGEMLEERLRSAEVRGPERGRAVADALERVGLSAEVAQARARQLSGGQRQRVALARATIVPPSLLLCDEPTSALDASLASAVLTLIGRLRRELGMTVLFVTHDLAVARAVAERIVVMYLGRVVEVGPAAELIDRARHPYTQALVESVPELGFLPRPLRGEPANPLAVPDGCEFRGRCPYAAEECRERPTLVQISETASAACWRSRDAVTVEVAHGGR